MMERYLTTAGSNDDASGVNGSTRVRAPAMILMVLTMLSVSACGTLTQQLSQEDAATATVTTQIKAKLVEAESIDAAAVLVELQDKVIVLSGFVASDEEAAEVVNIAEQEAGEFTVKNELEVKQ